MRVARTKVFKSGNGLAVRFPKSWGLAAGAEYELSVEDDGSFLLRPIAETAGGLRGLYGAFSEGFLEGGRGEIEQSERDWPGTSDRQDAA